MIKLLFAGDFCSKDPEKIIISDELNRVMNSFDFKCINFEAPLERGEVISPNGRRLFQSELSPTWVEKRFNLVSLANNHMYDFGKEGLLATKKAFKKSTTIGAGNWEEAYKVEILEKEGVKIGFFSGTSSDFSSLKDKWTDKNKVGCAWINDNSVDEIIQLAKNYCDYLIVLSHGGIEFMDVPLPEWRDRYRRIIDLGADAVIGSHPHVPQGVENYKGKPIFYSIGNFFFDKDSKKKPLHWDNGLLAALELENGKINFYSIPIIKNDSFLDMDNSKSAKEHLEYISEILKNDEDYLRKINSDVLRLYDKYIGWFLMGLNAVELDLRPKKFPSILKKLFFLKRNHKVALHQIREESTRWLLTRALKLKSETEL